MDNRSRVAEEEFPQYNAVDFADYDFGNCITQQDPVAGFSDMDVIAAIYSTRGVFSEMAVLLGRSRSRVQQYVMSTRAMYAVFKDVQETAIDQVEKSLFQDALDGGSASARFIMQTIGKDRGYTTRVEQTGKDGAALMPDKIDLSKLSEEELELYANLQRKATSQS